MLLNLQNDAMMTEMYVLILPSATYTDTCPQHSRSPQVMATHFGYGVGMGRDFKVHLHQWADATSVNCCTHVIRATKEVTRVKVSVDAGSVLEHPRLRGPPEALTLLCASLLSASDAVGPPGQGRWDSHSAPYQ